MPRAAYVLGFATLCLMGSVADARIGAPAEPSSSGNTTVVIRKKWSLNQTNRIQELEANESGGSAPPMRKDMSFDGPIEEYRFRLRWWREYLAEGGRATEQAWRAFFQGDLWPPVGPDDDGTML